MNPKVQQQQKKPSWKVHAYFLDACNCDWGCPCQFNANPTHGNCEGIAGYHIITGSYGTKVKLGGLNMAFGPTVLQTSWNIMGKLEPFEYSNNGKSVEDFL